MRYNVAWQEARQSHGKATHPVPAVLSSLIIKVFPLPCREAPHSHVIPMDNTAYHWVGRGLQRQQPVLQQKTALRYLRHCAPKGVPFFRLKMSSVLQRAIEEAFDRYDVDRSGKIDRGT